MSVSLTVDDAVRLVSSLPPAEQLRVVGRIVQDLADRSATKTAGGNAWLDLYGIVEAPALGEDAQEWVSRTRRESDQQRTIP